MVRVFSGLFKWSLEITGLSIILFNYQPFERQQQLQALYNSGRNTMRAAKYLYGVVADAKQLFSMPTNTPEYDKKLQEFISKSSSSLGQLCEANKGVYARIGQILANMTGVLPLQYLIQFKKLNSINADQVPYENIKNTLTQSLSKPMTELFDGFQKKPTRVGLLYQEHKSILLQNFKQSIVKVVPPATRYQCQYDLWVINKFLSYLTDYAKKNQAQSESKLAEYVEVIKEAQNFVLEEVDFDREVKNADKMAELIEQQGSTLYFPYYYKKYTNKNVVIKQNVDGTSILDLKGLKELGLSPQIAYACLMSDVHKLMKKLNLINGEVGQNDFMIRKYIKPAKRTQKQIIQPQSEVQDKDKATSKRVRAEIIKKGRELIHPPYQIVLTNLSTLREVPNDTKEQIQNYWVNMKKNSSGPKKYVPSIGSFYQRIPILNNLKDRPAELMKQKFYLYESMLRIYETMMQKRTESQK